MGCQSRPSLHSFLRCKSSPRFSVYETIAISKDRSSKKSARHRTIRPSLLRHMGQSAMFGNDPSHIPIRARRDLQRAAHLRAMMSNSNRPAGPYGLDPWDLSTPRPGLGRSNSFSGRSGSYPTSNYRLGSPFTPPSSAFTTPISPSLRSPSLSTATGAGYNDRRRAHSPRVGSTSFAKAARALHDALEPALAFNHSFELNFNHETEPLLAYLDLKVIDHLWRAKVEWDGVDRYTQHKPGATEVPDAPSFGDHAARLLEALDKWRGSGRLSSRDVCDVDGKLSPQDVMTAVQKLEISLEAIEGLLEAVRTEKKRHQALVKELRSACGLLEDLRELWKQTPAERRRFK